MREILFRGKTQKGEWVQGVPFFEEKRCFIIEDLFICDEYNCTGAVNSMVIPETVGQYTGLTDKNGKKIFEGDIVKITDENVDFETKAYIEFGNPNGQYNWGWQLVPLERKPFAVDILHWVEMEETGAFVEIIGNIYDNPELLKGGEADA